MKCGMEANMARKRHQDRNKVARATMEEKKLMRERMEMNEETKRKNIEEEIPAMEEKLKELQEAFELDHEGDRIKLTGLDVIEARFEFERSDAWKEWNRKSIEMSMKRREKQFAEMKKQIEERLESLKEQNKRIDKENSELTDSLTKQNGDSSNYIG